MRNKSEKRMRCRRKEKITRRTGDHASDQEAEKRVTQRKIGITQRSTHDRVGGNAERRVRRESNPRVTCHSARLAFAGIDQEAGEENPRPTSQNEMGHPALPPFRLTPAMPRNSFLPLLCARRLPRLGRGERRRPAGRDVNPCLSPFLNLELTTDN